MLWVVLLWGAQAVLAASWETEGFRLADGKLVRKGMSAGQVLNQAGNPGARRVVTTGINIGGQSGETVEVWTYRGHDGHYEITLTGDKVTRIEVTPIR